MKIALCQIKPKSGDVTFNISKHIEFIHKAIYANADFICFPELSLTGYEPGLAKELSMGKDDPLFEIFKQISIKNNCTIVLGIPTPSANLPKISLLIFRPNNSIDQYHKQWLHKDEIPYFSAGDQQVFIQSDKTKIALAICYESLQPQHLKNVIMDKANLYLASVAKSQTGVNKAYQYFSKMAKHYKIPILMVNSVGPCDNFISFGTSGVWNTQGKLLNQLDNNEEGILIYDTATENIQITTV